MKSSCKACSWSGKINYNVREWRSWLKYPWKDLWFIVKFQLETASHHLMHHEQHTTILKKANSGKTATNVLINCVLLTTEDRRCEGFFVITFLRFLMYKFYNDYDNQSFKRSLDSSLFQLCKCHCELINDSRRLTSTSWDKNDSIHWSKNVSESSLN